MKLTAKAHRFITEAIRDLPNPKDRDRLMIGMDRHLPGAELSPDMATLALSALEFYEAWLRQCLNSRSLSEDRRADIINDVGFVRAIAVDLRKEIHPVAVA